MKINDTDDLEFSKLNSLLEEDRKYNNLEKRRILKENKELKIRIYVFYFLFATLFSSYMITHYKCTNLKEKVYKLQKELNNEQTRVFFNNKKHKASDRRFLFTREYKQFY